MRGKPPLSICSEAQTLQLLSLFQRPPSWKKERKKEIWLGSLKVQNDATLCICSEALPFYRFLTHMFSTSREALVLKTGPRGSPRPLAHVLADTWLAGTLRAPQARRRPLPVPMAAKLLRPYRAAAPSPVLTPLPSNAHLLAPRASGADTTETSAVLASASLPGPSLTGPLPLEKPRLQVARGAFHWRLVARGVALGQRARWAL